jgi:hypothetical protein
MTSKEALKDISYLILQEVDNLKYKDLWKEALNTIKQDLERLERLEIENRNNEKVVADSVKLMNRNLELQGRLEMLEKENKELKGLVDSLNKEQILEVEMIFDLEIENEKLKKAIECMKKYYKIVVCECDFPIYEKVHTYTLGIRFHDWSEKSEGLIEHIFKEEYELLKEVLENE